MSRQDLGTIIVFKEDIDKLGIKLSKLQKIDTFKTPSKNARSPFNPHKKLKRYIEKNSEKEKADLAVIIHEPHEFSSNGEFVWYEYSLYRYR